MVEINSIIQKPARIAHYDSLRGIAISLMLVANSAATVYLATPPFWMRLVGSFAAPSFLLLVGMMLALSKQPKPLRGLSIIGVAALMDSVLWQMMPFVTFDVLYTIGVSIILLAYPARIFSNASLWGLGLALLLAGQGLQTGFGYQHTLLEITLPYQDALPPITEIGKRVLQQFFIDGWFPLFPWLGFVCLGAALQRSLAEINKHNKPLIAGIVVLMLGLSAYYWSVGFVAPEPREGYSELFYPADIGFCLTYFSAYCLVFLGLQASSRSQIMTLLLRPFSWLGQRSLWVYVLHLVAIKFILTPYFATHDLLRFFCAILVLWLMLILLVKTMLMVSKRNSPH
ncbi:MAG: heparan-alpha-glucosaminide N-acetyltransferase domain-containing protein [Methylococcales bacterium]|nr:heparan-alpha-glucosaminide N-acetyltransferase domain-containing protein [Methylococcales bacterium]